MKKILIIIGSILFITTVGVAMYLFFTNRAHIVVTKQNTTQPAFPTATASTTNTTTTVTNTSSTTKVQGDAQKINQTTDILPRLIRVSSGPVVPSIFSFDLTSTTTASTTPVIVQYIDQQSGNIYQYNSSTGKKARISNKTIPGIHSASWLSDGSLAYVQYLSHTGNNSGNVSTYALPKNGVGGFFLPQGLSEVFTKGANTFLALSSGENGSIVKEANKDASNVYTAFQTPLSSIRVMVAGSKNYIVYTKPSAIIDGYVFLEQGSSGILTPLVGPEKGMVALVNHSGTNVLISYLNSVGSMETELVSTKTHTIIQLPVPTIASKCVWSQNDSTIYCGVPQNPPNKLYPDSWYQGVVSFTDQVWEINVTGRYAKLLLDFSKEEGSPLDAIALSIDSKQQVLSFINKRTGALWAYRLFQ